MPPDPSLQIAVIQGPSVLAPYAAVVAEFPTPPGPARTADEIGRALETLLTPDFLARVALPLADGAFETVAGALANALQDAQGPCGLPVRATRDLKGRSRILLGFHDAGAAIVALQTGLQVAAAVFRHLGGKPVDNRALNANLQQAVTRIVKTQPDPLAHALLRVARRRGIPACSAAPGSQVWVYGQGAAGFHFFEAANHRDGLTGSRLARNKFFSNRLITRLGLPGVRHYMVPNAEEARKAAAELGFPVVIKPVDSGKGSGVTAGITSHAAVDAAFEVANRESPGKVLVEAHIHGEDHRLAVFGGRFAWAVRRSPPRVTGDGVQSVLELIAAENARRHAAPNPDIAGTAIVVDAEVEALLASQALSLGARPAAGTSVALGRVANISRGGTLTDCSAAIHPDNRAMAEAIARSFHLDATGIDFMTPDISRSWREVPCGVLELNSTPGFSSDGRAEIILGAKFPSGSDGRLPSVLLVDAGPSAMADVAGALAATGRRVGWTDAVQTGLGDERRFISPATLPERATALVLDPATEALVVSATADDLSTHGLPLDRFDLVLVTADTGLSGAGFSLLKECCNTVRRDLPPEGVGSAAAPVIETLLARRAAGEMP